MHWVKAWSLPRARQHLGLSLGFVKEVGLGIDQRRRETGEKRTRRRHRDVGLARNWSE